LAHEWNVEPAGLREYRGDQKDQASLQGSRSQ
jgi:hypothetical protein